MSRDFILEVCVDSVDSAIAAEQGGAHRVELCGSLADGGLTPSAGLIAVVRQRIAIPLHVMIRPRGADFCYSDDEFAVMQRDLVMAKQLRADGAVLGVLTLDGKIDIPRTKDLVTLAAPLTVTFHRAFDMTGDLVHSLADVKAAGAHRILTSGGKQTAAEGASTLKQLIDSANGTIGIMAASGIAEHNVTELLQRTGVREVHASLRSPLASSMRYQNHHVSMGAAHGREYNRLVADQNKIRALLSAISN
jgi:copper homeostasis protein